MPMTDDEKSKCQKIIHGHAAAAAAGNLVPIPTTMAMALASVFGGSITESVAKTMAINAIVATIKKQPVKIIAKEISKVVPIVGQLVAPSISVAMLESAGWLLANELIDERDKKLSGSKELLAEGVHNSKYDKPFKTHEEYIEEHNNPKPKTLPAEDGHLFKYDSKFKTHDDKNN